MGDLDGVVVDREQPGVGQGVDDPPLGGVVAQLSPWHPSSRVGSALSRVHQPQQEPLRDGLLVAGELVVLGVGPLGYGAGHPSGRAEALEGEDVPPAPQPGLHQRVGHQRQGSGRRHVVEDGVDETVLESQPDLFGRSFDGRAQLGPMHRPDEHLVVADGSRQPLVAGALAVEVGAEREDDPHPAGGGSHELGEYGDEGGDVVGLVEREELLELVDREERPADARGQRPHRAGLCSEPGRRGHPSRVGAEVAQDLAQLGERVGTRRQQQHRPALAAREGAGLDRGHQPGPEQ